MAGLSDEHTLTEYYFTWTTNHLAWNNMQKIRYFMGGFSDIPLLETRIMCCRSIWTRIAPTLHGHPHRSLVAQQQFSSSLEAKKLHNYSSSQKRIWGVRHVTSFSKLFPASIRCGSEWMRKWGNPSSSIFHPSCKAKQCESTRVFTGLHWK